MQIESGIGTHCCDITFNLTDKEHLEKLGDILGADFPVVYDSTKGTLEFFYEIGSKSFDGLNKRLNCKLKNN